MRQIKKISILLISFLLTVLCSACSGNIPESGKTPSGQEKTVRNEMASITLQGTEYTIFQDTAQKFFNQGYSFTTYYVSQQVISSEENPLVQLKPDMPVSPGKFVIASLNDDTIHESTWDGTLADVEFYNATGKECPVSECILTSLTVSEDFVYHGLEQDSPIRTADQIADMLCDVTDGSGIGIYTKRGSVYGSDYEITVSINNLNATATFQVELRAVTKNGISLRNSVESAEKF